MRKRKVGSFNRTGFMPSLARNKVRSSGVQPDTLIDLWDQNYVPKK